MKPKLFLPIIGGLFIILFFSQCSKEDIKLDKIDPDEHPSELSRALLIKNGINHRGSIPTVELSYDLTITNSQTSALITPDNFLFVPFIYESTPDANGVYLQIEGADNYWEIPIRAENIGNKIAEVLSIGVPENVIDGSFYLNYTIFGKTGKTGNIKSLRTTVELPEDYCSDGSSFPQVEGSDGIAVKSYIFGDEPGFISIEFDTYSVPDRVDIRYGNEWIRSTGQLLSNADPVPPIKECSDVTADDGFLGQQGVFNIFYDPKKFGDARTGKKIDVYVSGCLDGGTAWLFRVKECPKDKPVLGIHSNAGPSSVPLEAVVIGGELVDIESFESLGHAWISLTQAGNTTYYGLWPDGHPSAGDNGSTVSDIRMNLESGAGTYSRYYPLDESQMEQLHGLLMQNIMWKYTYTCAGFASQVYNIVTGENVNASESLGAFWTTFTPRKLSAEINRLESQNPTSNFRPDGLATDDSSCSFCF
jgi:hypothetical protein